MPSSATEVTHGLRDADEVVIAEGVAVERPAGPLSGRELLALVEDVYNRLAMRTLQRNPFWRAMVEAPARVPHNVFYGMCIENYHLLFRESYFDAPVLSYPASRQVRFLVNEFYCEEIGHDELLLQALESIGLSRDGLFASVPLDETMALCNALSYWARHDPLFFFTTLGPLEGRDVEIDSYVVAARGKGLPEAFVGPILAHANINKSSKHGLLTREVFDAIPAVSARDAVRILRTTPLFIDVYDRFYAGAWNFYRDSAELLRPVDGM